MFINHIGDSCPVPGDTHVRVLVEGDPHPYSGVASEFAWGLSDEPGRIESYEILAPKADTKPTNPKDAIGVRKLPTHLVPDTLLVYGAMAFAEGASKYGAYNWRVAGVRASIYKAAHDRHVAKWWNGEACDPKTGVPHLASAIACLAILADAKLCGKLTDDRPPRAEIATLIEDAEAVVAQVCALNAHHSPRHCTIEDSPASPCPDRFAATK